MKNLLVDLSRRELLKLLGAGTAALALAPAALAGGGQPMPKLGLQLYTVRAALERDLEATIRRVADVGFVGIETYALPANVPLERAARVVRDSGLRVLGMHVELPVGERREAALRLADAYACDRVIDAGWPQGGKYQDVAATRRTLDVYNETAEFLAGKGLRFGLHNHWWEFEQTDGIVPFYYLLEHLDARVFFEIDTYWARVAGADPARVVADFGERAPLLHVKDGPAVKGEAMDRQVPAGAGVIDFPAIARAGGGNTEWMIVEFDEYAGDIFEGIRKSYAYIAAEGLAAGRV
jgi:sugar phosphate isomerase/epimerase